MCYENIHKDSLELLVQVSTALLRPVVKSLRGLRVALRVKGCLLVAEQRFPITERLAVEEKIVLATPPLSSPFVVPPVAAIAVVVSCQQIRELLASPSIVVLDRVMSHFKPHPILFWVLYNMIWFKPIVVVCGCHDILSYPERFELICYHCCYPIFKQFRISRMVIK